MRRSFNIVPTMLLYAAALCGLAGATQSALAQPVATQEPAELFIGIKAMKAENVGELSWSVKFPASCPTCRVAPEPVTTAQNDREFYFHIFAPPAAIPKIELHVRPGSVRRLFVGDREVAIHQSADGIVFDVPEMEIGEMVPLFHTVIEQPGVRLRIQHADVLRRNGPYKEGRWPETESRAVLNLEMATAEAIRALGLGRVMQDRNLGTFQIMGFDTNYPTYSPTTAHADAPPHWHMHVYWASGPQIRTIDHLYVGADGLLLANKPSVRVKGRQGEQGRGPFGRGETFNVYTPSDAFLYSQTITERGEFILATADGACRYGAVRGGFQNGVALACGESAPRIIRADTDLARGEVRLFSNDAILARHIFDPDSGQLIRSTYDNR